ncbi:MAG: hypothetical protein ACD_71C00192G0003 [uncultured bacterium (gcode 4)]|uniref:Uncharacterized protein n=1 Tax=uncultured bacterium (gcode 4) TaxID=1234023 RepID=K1Z4S3_9BACT|nr:MAG: hypothetical protein ACD_71C00192G0003 [uncultured bacterium (gcode 4)]
MKINQENENQNKEYLYNYTRRMPHFNEKIQDIIVSPKIDLIRFSFSKQTNSISSLNNFFNKLNSITETKSKPLKQYKDGYNHSRIYNIKLNNRNYETILSECHNEQYMPYLWVVHDPEKSIMNDLDTYLSLLDQYNINSVEYAFDFSYKNINELYDFAKRTVLLAWRGKGLHLPYESTYYLNNNYSAWSKAGKIYRKMIPVGDGNEQEVLRLELTFKYYMFKRIGLKSCLDIMKIKVKDVIKYITWKQFNFNLFENKLIQKEYSRQAIDNLLLLFKQDIKNGFLFESNITANTYWKSNKYLKKHVFDNHFKEKFSGKSFWDKEEVYLDSSLIEV